MKLRTSLAVRTALAVGAALAATALLTTPAQAGVSGQYQFRNAATGKCLDVRAGSKDDGTPLQQFSCNGKGNQTFIVEFRVDDPTSMLSAQHSYKCMQAVGATPGSQVVQRACDNLSSMRWEFVELGGGSVTIKNMASGLCLDDGGQPSGSRREVRQTVCTGAATQVWGRS
ncbi:RICIN domain-containing protein [Streptomyces sp. NPDC048507]|uniref:RICIN domain-containing protein n=1 Tax=Streptomyces sp. NPDC048507 TaxID=3365560 RepID=UPI00371F906B